MVIYGFGKVGAFVFGIFEQIVQGHAFGGFDRNAGIFCFVFHQPSFQSLGYLAAILVAELLVLLHHLDTDPIEFTGAVGPIDSYVGGHGVLVFDDPARDTPVRERRMACEQEVHGAAKPIDIGSVVDGMAIHRLFGGEIIGCTEDLVVVLHRQRCIAFVLEKRQAQVENLDNAFGVDQKVRRFHIPVDHALIVSMLQTMGSLGDIICH